MYELVILGKKNGDLPPERSREFPLLPHTEALLKAAENDPFILIGVDDQVISLLRDISACHVDRGMLSEEQIRILQVVDELMQRKVTLTHIAKKYGYGSVSNLDYMLDTKASKELIALLPEEKRIKYKHVQIQVHPFSTTSLDHTIHDDGMGNTNGTGTPFNYKHAHANGRYDIEALLPRNTRLLEGMQAWENFAKGQGVVLLRIDATVSDHIYSTYLEVTGTEIIGATSVQSLEKALHDQAYQTFFQTALGNKGGVRIAERLARQAIGITDFSALRDQTEGHIKSIFILLNPKTCEVDPDGKHFVMSRRPDGNLVPLGNSPTIAQAVTLVKERTVGPAHFGPAK